MYTFKDQLREGVRGEHALDVFFAPAWIITPATGDEQRQGIDRHFTHRMTGQPLTIEYKTDYVAGRTHNAFLETVSVDTPVERPGWVFTCEADYVLYYVPGDGLVYVLDPLTLRHFVQHLSHWRYPVSVPNRGYRTWGYPVPLRVLERRASSVISV
jgi:hypothetical protein